MTAAVAHGDDLESSIDEWVLAQLDTSPVWGREKWETLGSILDVEFSLPGEQAGIDNFVNPGNSTSSEAA